MVPGRFHGFSWFQVGFSWFQVGFYGFSWFLVGFFVVPGWFFVVPGQFSWYFRMGWLLKHLAPDRANKYNDGIISLKT